MLRSVLSAIPSHAMSCYKLPQGLCDQIQSLLTRFWWDTAQDKRSMSWIFWKKMAGPKKLGGLSFKDIPRFNDVLLAKLSWRILKNPTCMLSISSSNKKILHDWKSVLIGRDLLIKHLGWTVGSGISISLWNDPWLSSTDQLRPYGPAPEVHKDLMVSDLMFENSTDWDITKLDLIFPFHKAVVLQIKPSICSVPD